MMQNNDNARATSSGPIAYALTLSQQMPEMIQLLWRHGGRTLIESIYEYGPNTTEREALHLVNMHAETLHAVDQNGFTALHAAAYTLSLPFLKALLWGQNISINLIDPTTLRTPLLIASLREGSAPVLQFLLGNGAYRAAVDIYMASALHCACVIGDEDAVKVLLQDELMRSMINARTLDGNTPLMCALLTERYHIIPLLLAHGANPLITNNLNQSAITFPCNQPLSYQNISTATDTSSGLFLSSNASMLGLNNESAEHSAQNKQINLTAPSLRDK